MIERHVYLKLTDPGSAEALASRAATALSEVPGLVDLTVATPADAGARVWDLALTARFPSLPACVAGVASPAWTRFFEGEVAPRAEVQKAWNFEARLVSVT